ncbi:hypothetical protein GCM10018966_001030 [Streptomyces yanii]
MDPGHLETGCPIPAAQRLLLIAYTRTMPLADVAELVFEETAPVWKFPSYRGQTSSPPMADWWTLSESATA